MANAPANLASQIGSSTTEEQVFRAKKFYFAGVTFENIVNLTSINPKALKELIETPSTGWRALKEASEDFVITSAVIDRLNTAINCSSIATATLLQALKDLKFSVEAGRELSVKEMKGVSDIIDSLDKIIRLEKGTPTDIIGKQSLTVEEARAVLKADPFSNYDIIDAEVVSES